MNKSIISLFLIISTSTTFANTFIFNNKNINSLVTIICENSLTAQKSNTIYLNKINISQTKYGPHRLDKRFDITGTCNGEIDSKTREFISFGNEINLTFDLNKTDIFSGTIGIDTFEIIMNKKRVTNLKINSFVENKTIDLNLRRSKWAQSNSLINLNDDSIKIIADRKRHAVEDNRRLIIGKDTILYNLWTHQAFSCKSDSRVSRYECENLSNKIEG